MTSPPAFTKKHVAPAARRISPARATAHPLTMPDGSSGASPGRGATCAWAPNEMSNAPPLLCRTSSLNARTSHTSGLASCARRSPRPIRMISVSGRHVLNRSSTRRNQAKQVSTTCSSIRSRTSTVITVPHCSSIRSTGRTRTCGLTCGPGRVRFATTARSCRSCTWLRTRCRCARSGLAAPPAGGRARLAR